MSSKKRSKKRMRDSKRSMPYVKILIYYICPIYFFRNNRGCIDSMKSGSKTNKLSDEKHMHYLK